MSVGLISSPEKHTVHKTLREHCFKHEQVVYRVYKPPPDCVSLCGLLNNYLMAVDFTNYRETGRFILLNDYLLVYRFERLDDCRLISLSVWQCYIAKYP
jgi:hypothetical protein